MLKRLLLAAALAAGALMAVAQAATAATVTVPASSITATSSGATSFVMGATAIQMNMTLSGTVRAGTYVGTLGVTQFNNIASLNTTTCSALTVGWITRCLGPWPIHVIFNGSNATFIKQWGLLIENTIGTIRCLILTTVVGTYDRTTGVLNYTGATSSTTATPLTPGACPAGTPSVRGTARISPLITWALA